METEDEKQAEFLDELENFYANAILYQIENLYPSISWTRSPRTLHNNTVAAIFMSHIDETRPRWILPGIDLKAVNGDVVKHHSYSELSPYIDDRDYVFGETITGRFLHGYIKQGSEDKYVVIKTWDLPFPPRADMDLQTRRLHNELNLLPNLKHSNLPKLIGYSIDKKLAVVYDMNPCMNLVNVLKHDDFGWEDRLKVAIQVANLLKYFHEMEITVGSVDSMNILVDLDDKDIKIKLCEFGLTARMKEMKYGKNPIDYVAGSNNRIAPELKVAEGDKWMLPSDIFAFGHFLLDLIIKKRFTPSGRETWLYRVLDDHKSKPDKLSLVDASFLDDPNIGYIITDLAVKCVQKTPACRPTAEFVYNELKKLEESYLSSVGSKKRKSCP